MLLSMTSPALLLITYYKYCFHLALIMKVFILITIIFAKLIFLLCIKSSLLGDFLSIMLVFFHVPMVKAEVGTGTCYHGYRWHQVGLKVCDDEIIESNYVVSEIKQLFKKKKLSVKENSTMVSIEYFMLSLFFYTLYGYEERCLVAWRSNLEVAHSLSLNSDFSSVANFLYPGSSEFVSKSV